MKYILIPILICASSAVFADNNVLNDEKTKVGWEKEKKRVETEKMKSELHNESYPIDKNTSIGKLPSQPPSIDSQPTPPPASSKEDIQKNPKEASPAVGIKHDF